MVRLGLFGCVVASLIPAGSFASVGSEHPCGIRDPFVAVTSEQAREIRVAPESLRLTGIVVAGDRRLALVEDGVGAFVAFEGMVLPTLDVRLQAIEADRVRLVAGRAGRELVLRLDEEADR